MAEKIIENLGLNKYFDFIVGSQKNLKLKPHTDMLKKCVDTLNLRTNETIFVGDSINDILPANELGITSVFVKYGYGKLEGSVKPNTQISDIIELKNYI